MYLDIIPTQEQNQIVIDIYNNVYQNMIDVESDVRRIESFSTTQTFMVMCLKQQALIHFSYINGMQSALRLFKQMIFNGEVVTGVFHDDSQDFGLMFGHRLKIANKKGTTFEATEAQAWLDGALKVLGLFPVLIELNSEPMNIVKA